MPLKERDAIVNDQLAPHPFRMSRKLRGLHGQRARTLRQYAARDNPRRHDREEGDQLQSANRDHRTVSEGGLSLADGQPRASSAFS